MTLTVVAVADAALIRVGIAAALAEHADLRLVATATSAAEASALVETLAPDVILIDHELADGEGLSYGGRLREGRPRLGVVLLAPRDDHLVFRALESGISAYVLRSTPVDELIAALRHAAVAPASFTAPDLAGVIARRRRHTSVLSSREIEVLGLIADGQSTQRISAKLGVSESTVKTYLSRVYDKLGVRTRSDALAAAARVGLLRPHQSG
jgi:DNA-binding NarL/FixJ family response regulator